MKRYCTPAEYELLPVEERAHYRTELAENEHLVIMSQAELLAVESANRVMRNIAGGSVFDRTVGYSREYSKEREREIWDITLGWRSDW